MIVIYLDKNNILVQKRFNYLKRICLIHNMVMLNQLQSENLEMHLHKSKISQYVYTATSRIRLDVCKLNVKSQPHVLKFDTA